ncbi:CalY family protein [Halobaculum sp. CBA1158]|uniref:TasA family protein n=1 Tax=Halobaculum sp. CBA1158 TaxID=2904243 RepID=UPI001F1AA21C|nr:TasA family protein [Halobaculum sp. CBA1158]UIO99190.1 CalY family protein [Halobaculum sp. CBA1158]
MTREDTPTLGRRRLLSSIAAVGAASAAAGVGTWALFSDSEPTRGRVTAGTLDLVVDGGSGATLDVGPVDPGDSGVAAIPIANRGNVPGQLRLTLRDVVLSQGDENDDEREGNKSKEDVDSDEDDGNEIDEENDGDDGDSSRGDGVHRIEFDGCGRVEITFDRDFSFPVDVVATVRRGGDDEAVQRKVRADDVNRGSGTGKSKGKGDGNDEGSDGTRPTFAFTPRGGRVVSVTVGGRTWENPSPCAGGGSNGEDGDGLAEALTLRIGVDDSEPVDASSPAIGPAEAGSIDAPRTVDLDRTLAPAGAGDGDDTAVLYVAWSVEDDPDDEVAGESARLTLVPEVYT